MRAPEKTNNPRELHEVVLAADQMIPARGEVEQGTPVRKYDVATWVERMFVYIRGISQCLSSWIRSSGYLIESAWRRPEILITQISKNGGSLYDLFSRYKYE